MKAIRKNQPSSRRTAKYVLSYTRSDGRGREYVAAIDRSGPGDPWEWTQNPSEAGAFSFHESRRFMADRRACGIKTDER